MIHSRMADADRLADRTDQRLPRRRLVCAERAASSSSRALREPQCHPTAEPVRNDSLDVSRQQGENTCKTATFESHAG
jgi:hypothetical protein